MKKILTAAVFVCILGSCKKDTECYTAYDTNGNDIGGVCGKSETDCFDKVKGQIYNGAAITTKAQFEATFKHN